MLGEMLTPSGTIWGCTVRIKRFLTVSRNVKIIVVEQNAKLLEACRQSTKLKYYGAFC